MTIFQRYINEQRWTGCGHFNPSRAFDTSYGSIKYDLLKNLVEGKIVDIEVNGINKVIQLF